MLEEDMSESFSIFRNNLKKLACLNLLEWHLIDKGIHVTLADINEDE
jgi:hypothetical protein